MGPLKIEVGSGRLLFGYRDSVLRNIRCEVEKISTSRNPFQQRGRKGRRAGTSFSR
jgi:hypothetical protein